MPGPGHGPGGPGGANRFAKPKNTKKTALRILGYLSKSKLPLLGVGLCLLITVGCNLGGSYYMRPFINMLVGGGIAGPADLLLAGTYKGYTDADCTYFQDRYTDDESLKVTANGDGTLAVLFESAAWGTFKVDKATVRKNGDNYTITGEGTVSMSMGDNVKDYAFTMTGESNAAKDDYSIAFNVPAVMGGLTVTLLPGKAPATAE